MKPLKMRTVNGVLQIAFALLFLLPKNNFPQDRSVYVRLFHGTWEADQQGLKEDLVLTSADTPAIEQIKAKLGSPSNELTESVINILMDTTKLNALNDVLSFMRPWNDKEITIEDTVVQKETAYKIEIIANSIADNEYKIRATIYRSEKQGVSSKTQKSGDKDILKAAVMSPMIKILSRDMVLSLDNPVIVGVPVERSAYFMMIVLKSGNIMQPSALEAPIPLNKVMPSYPYELKKKGIEGEVRLRVSIDVAGVVQNVEVIKTLHPVLDYAALQALRQWTYMPIMQQGKPIPAIFEVAVRYRNRKESEVLKDEPKNGPATALRELSPFSKDRLEFILVKCAEYCRKMIDSATSFICEEVINDTFYNFHDENSVKNSTYVVTGVGVNRSGLVGQQVFIPFWDVKRTERNKYHCDYLLIKGDGEIEDRRIILEKNGVKSKERNTILRDDRYSAILPFLAPILLFGGDRQSLFDYKLLKEENIGGKKAHVIEIVPKSRNSVDIQSAKAWIDAGHFQTLKIEMKGIPLKGYERVLDEISRCNIEPLFELSHSYQIEHNGVLFPHRSSVKVIYPWPDSQWYVLKKISTDISYNQYKFFSVETETNAIY